MKPDEELHAELLSAFRQYFEANQRLVNEGTKRAGMDTRYWLSEIRRICSLRRVSIQEWRKWKDSDLAIRNEKRKAQKQQASRDDDAN
jgi:hypothetical protein